MSDTLLDFSQRPELALHATVIAAVQQAANAQQIPTMITGAFARDLHIFYAHGIDTHRQTEDVDFAIAVTDWPAFARLANQLVQQGDFRSVDGRKHRLRHSASGLPVDLVPFSGVETSDRYIEWPAEGDIVMDVFGFREALADATRTLLPSGVETLVASLPGLALLKLVAWHDRHRRSPLKDAHDLMLISSTYLRLGNEGRLWERFTPWTQETDFDYRLCGARLLGHDIRALVDDGGSRRVAAILEEQLAGGDRAGELAAEMNRRDPHDAGQVLRAILRGFSEPPP